MTTLTPTFPRTVAGTWTLTSSMIHGGDVTLGTTRLFRSKGFIVDGRKVRIPIVSGNALRGVWRRQCAFAFLDAYLDAGGEPIELSAFYYLTSGGSLKKGSTAGALDLAGERALRDLIPHASVFGGAGMGRIQAGKLWVDEAVPICRETVPLLRMLHPAVEDAATANLSYRELTEIHGYSRQDDGKNEHLKRYLSARAGAELTGRIERGETEDVAESAGTPQQMRYEQQELVAGTVLFHRWGFEYAPTDHEIAGLGAGLLRWAERPRIGGRSAVGHGGLLPRYEGITTETRLLSDGSSALGALADRTPEEALREHVAGNLGAIRSVLASL